MRMGEDLTTFIDHISTENEGMQVLAKVMHTYIDRWDVPTMEALLSDLVTFEEEVLPMSLRRRLQFIKENLLFPLANILAVEKDKNERERQMLAYKEQAFVSTIHSLVEERNSAVRQFREEADLLEGQNTFVETLLRDFDEIAQAVRAYRKTVKSLQHLLIDKELEVQQLLADKEELIRRALTNGPKAVLEWFKKDLQSQGQELGYNFEEQWLSQEQSNEAGKAEGVTIAYKDSQTELSTSPVSIYTTQQEFPSPASAGVDQKSSLLHMVLLGIWRETLSSLNLVIDNGVFAIPFAVVDFWAGLICYMADHMSDMSTLDASEQHLSNTSRLLRRFTDKQ